MPPPQAVAPHAGRYALRNKYRGKLQRAELASDGDGSSRADDTAGKGLFLRPGHSQILAEHHSMPIRRRHDELSHPVRFIGGRLQNNGAVAQKFFVKGIGVVDVEIAKIAVIAHCRWRKCIRAMAHHNAHFPSRCELPAGTFRPFEAKAQCVAKV